MTLIQQTALLDQPTSSPGVVDCRVLPSGSRSENVLPDHLRKWPPDRIAMACPGIGIRMALSSPGGRICTTPRTTPASLTVRVVPNAYAEILVIGQCPNPGRLLVVIVVIILN